MAVPSYPFLQEVVGRSGTFSPGDGSNAAKRVWRLIFNAPQASLPNPDALPLPKIGDAHPVVPGAILKTWEVTEESSASFVLTATYAIPSESEAQASGGDDEEDEEVETSREWTGGETSRDLCADAVTGDAVLLPTGEPFESVPSVPVSVMSFIVKRKSRRFNQAALATNCTVNKEPVTIDGVTIAKHCGRLKVSTRKLYGGKYRYETTFTVDIVSNMVKLTPDGEAEDIGHDVALLLSGFRFFRAVGEGGGNAGDTELVRATEIDEETGEEKPAAAPVLLDAAGNLYTPDVVGKAYYKRIAAVKEASWSATWFGEK
jgi:hypothetical protein